MATLMAGPSYADPLYRAAQAGPGAAVRRQPAVGDSLRNAQFWHLVRSRPRIAALGDSVTHEDAPLGIRGMEASCVAALSGQVPTPRSGARLRAGLDGDCACQATIIDAAGEFWPQPSSCFLMLRR
jgi:hypothetical protein